MISSSSGEEEGTIMSRMCQTLPAWLIPPKKIRGQNSRAKKSCAKIGGEKIVGQNLRVKNCGPKFEGKKIVGQNMRTKNFEGQ